MQKEKTRDRQVLIVADLKNTRTVQRACAAAVFQERSMHENKTLRHVLLYRIERVLSVGYPTDGEDSPKIAASCLRST